jgi:hypothetical protein
MDNEEIYGCPSLTEEEKRENLRKVFDLADKEAEKFSRVECLRVQAKIEELRRKVEQLYPGTFP